MEPAFCGGHIRKKVRVRNPDDRDGAQRLSIGVGRGVEGIIRGLPDNGDLKSNGSKISETQGNPCSSGPQKKKLFALHWGAKGAPGYTACGRGL